MAVPVKYLKKTRTEPSLKAALLEKMETKAVAKITIKELCETAEVYRSTFYCHYNDVESLYAALEKEIFAKIDALYDAYIGKEITGHVYCRTLCELVRNRKLNLTVLFQLDNPDSKAFVTKLVKHMTVQIKALYSHLEDKQAECATNTVIATGIACIVSMTSMTPDEVAEAICKVCDAVK